MSRMNGVSGTIGRLLNNWPLKLGAFAFATLLWFFVTTNNTSTTQRSLLIPLNVQGVGEDQVAIGLPDVIEVSVTGPSNRIDGLRPENFNATLDLTDVGGEFNVPITVQPPPRISLVRVNPGSVIGFVETVNAKTVPIESALIGNAAADLRLRAVAEPNAAQVRGRGQPLARTVRVLATAPAAVGTHEADLFAADTAGHPVSGITIDPETATVTVEAVPVFVERAVSLTLEPPAAPAGFELTLETESESVALLGPSSVLAGLADVSGTIDLQGGVPVDPLTGEPQAGRYTLPVRLALPDGVVARQPPSATVRLVRRQLDE